MLAGSKLVQVISQSAQPRRESPGLTLGILALQGDVPEHRNVLEHYGCSVRCIRRPSELDGIDALVLPGGESTAMERLVRSFGLLEPLQAFIASGRAVYGTCAGMVLLADRIVATPGPPRRILGGLDITVRRNAFGRQRESFESTVTLGSGPVAAAFIRAPWVETYGDNVEVLATVTVDGIARPVAVRSGSILATSFHTEVPSVVSDGGEGPLSVASRVHELFLRMVKKEA